MMALLGCCAKGCINTWEIPDSAGFISSDEIYARYGWYLTSTWDEREDYRNWDGMLWCPDHEVAAEDWIADYESL